MALYIVIYPADPATPKQSILLEPICNSCDVVLTSLFQIGELQDSKVSLQVYFIAEV